MRIVLVVFLVLFSLSSCSLFTNPNCPPCPSCFNCNLPSDKCENNGVCNRDIGKCQKCPVGFGGESCGIPLCGSPLSKDRPFMNPNTGCTCDPNWTGINCNICQNDDACLMENQAINSTCYKGNVIAVNQFKSCRAILPDFYDRLLGGKKPKVTYNCLKGEQDVNCRFEFWLDWEENFYCQMNQCNRILESGNVTYGCGNVSCSCVSNSSLCNIEKLTDISEVLRDVRGPSRLDCLDNECLFNEPTLDIYFMGGIRLDCQTGECVRPSQIPGNEPPVKKPNYLLISGIVIGLLVLLVLLALLFIYLVRKQRSILSYSSNIHPHEENQRLLDSHTPSKFVFSDVSYAVGNRTVLDKVGGVVEPGQVMAIMGGSGSGKTSCLDILARKEKVGKTTGTILVNGEKQTVNSIRKISGFVDQEDTLLGTLTVRETVMYSAMLRLPKDMSLEAKKIRVQQTLEELGIDHIADNFIGLPGRRGISGGEKRRVTIAQELVNSPSIIFLDEPTSGLDSYNAFVVIQTLTRMAKQHNRTVIFSIHQPRSNIFALFDQLLLLAAGKMIYSGPAHDAAMYFSTIGYVCPEGFNTADYLIDITLKKEQDPDMPSPSPSQVGTDPSEMEYEVALPRSRSFNPFSWLRKRGSRVFGSNQQYSRLAEDEVEIDERINFFKNQFKAHALWQRIHDESASSDAFPTVIYNASNKASQVRATFFQQVSILSGRTLINLYRNPFLLLSHYALSIVLAVFCGLLFWQISNDLAGVQNRLGCLFFICAFFAFGSLTSLEFFSRERIIFVRERANGFYSPSAYFFSKVLFDIIPLRMVPPLIFGSIVYYLIGFYASTVIFFKFLIVLVLFNLASASFCLVIAILFESNALANLTASLVILFSMLFGGFLLNKERIPIYLGWLRYLSLFNYAFEALIVNELANITLHDSAVVEIDIPGPVILKQFGFDVYGYTRDVAILGLIFMIMIVLAFVLLKFMVKERR